MRYMLLPLLAGCGLADPLAFEGIEVESARLEGARISTAAFIIGRVRGGADLVVEGTHGESVTGPVSLRGGTAGLSADLNMTEFPLSDIPLQLPREPVMGEELLGKYRGSSASFVSGIGVETHHLHNEAGVEIDQAFLAVGVGLMWGYEWVTMSAIDEGDTGDTGDTGADTGVDTGGAR